MWLKTFSGASGSGEVASRINLAHVLSFNVSGAGSVWVVTARLMDGSSSSRMNDTDFATRALAVAYIDELILNGS